MKNTISIKKIFHRDAFRIGVYFSYDPTIKELLKKLGAQYSTTFSCWYIDNTATAYTLLQQNFYTLNILDPKPKEKNSATTQMPFEEVAKHETISFAEKMKLQLMPNIGKYWVFKMHYNQETKQRLTTVKGVYWNTNYKCYMVFRNIKIKEIVEEILQTPHFFGTDYHQNDTHYKGKKINILPHYEHIAWMEIYVPKITGLIEIVKKMSFSRFSATKNAFLLPASPVVYEKILLQMEAVTVSIDNQLPKNYLQKKDLPNSKQLKLTQAKEGLFQRASEKAKTYLEQMMNTLLALNYSDSSIKTY